MTKKEKEKLINNITALVNISENVARSFHFKFLELKEMYKEEIDTYNRIKGLIENLPLMINFEMENKNGTWTVSIPDYPDLDHRIIPKEILTHITNNAADQGITRMVSDFETKDKREFNFIFEKKSESFITSTILEKRGNHSGETDLQSIPPLMKTAKLNYLEEIFYYLKDNEKFCDWLIGEFYEKWKPLIDNKCLNEG